MNTAIIPLFVTVFLVYFDHNFASPALDGITKSLGTNVEGGGYIIAIYSLAAALGAVLFGPISDRVGRKPLLQWGLAGFAISSIGCGLAWNFFSMQCFRALCGVCGGVLIASAFAYVADYCVHTNNEAGLAAAMGKVTSGVFAALVIGVPLGLFVTSLGSWRMPFIAVGVGGGLLLFPVAKLPSIRPPGKAMSYGASLLRYFSFLRSAPHLVLLTLFLLQLMPTALTAYAPSWFIKEGCSVPLLALIYCVASVGSVVSAMQSGAWAKKSGTKPLLIGLNLSMAAVAFFMVRVTFNLLTVTFLFALFSACLSARMAQMQAVSLQRVSLSERGRFSALISCFTQLGATIGVGGSAHMLSQLKLPLVPQGIVYIATAASVVLLATSLVCLLLDGKAKVWQIQGRAV